MALLTFKDVSKIYNEAGAEPVYALDKVCFEIQQGDFVAICGPSGSGKSTLLSILGILNTPTSGEVIIDDIDVYKLTPEKKADFRYDYIGFIFQSFQLIPYLTAIENVMVPLAISKLSGKEQFKMASEVLARVGLSDKLDKLPSQLSGGQVQRVAIARAIVNKPDILLADELTGNLDSKSGAEIMQLIKELVSEGETILMVTHDPHVATYANWTIDVVDGKVESKTFAKEKIAMGV